MQYIECVRRGTNDIDDGLSNLNDSRVQLLLAKFLLGGGTFKRAKFLYVIYIGPKCNILKRGKWTEKIKNFADDYLKGIANLTTADRASLSFESLVSHFVKVFIVDNVEFSKAQIRKEYLERLKEEQEKMHQEEEFEKKKARLRMIRARRMKEIIKEERQLVKNVHYSDSSKNNTMQYVMDAIRKEDDGINWAIFEPDPEKKEAVAYGCGGIFELVKNLPNDRWFFGLFKISLSNSNERQRRLILFQWIGNKAKVVRHRHLLSVYVPMSKLLSPYSYEIYLVGSSDLVPTAIVNKCRNAFMHQKNEAESNKVNHDTSCVVDIKNYTNTFIEDQESMLLNSTKLQPGPKEADNKTSVTDYTEMSITNLSDSFFDSIAGLYDVEETLRLIMSPEGGLTWAIFEAN